MKENNLDDLIVDSLKTDKGGKKNILALAVLFGIILLIAILLTKIMIDKPKITPNDSNSIEFVNNDLVMDINNTVDENESNITTQVDLKDANKSTVVTKELQSNKTEPAKIVVVVKTEDSQNEDQQANAQQFAPKVEKKVEPVREVQKVVYVKEPQKTVVKQEAPQVIYKREAPKVVYVKETPKAETTKEVEKREISKVVYIKDNQRTEYGLEDPGYEKTSEAKREALKREIKKIEYKKEAPKVEQRAEPAKAVVKKETAKATFYIQAGAFGSIDNAVKVEQSIREIGLEPRLLHKANVAKILIGPFSSQERADAILYKVKTKVNKDAFIIKQ